jgi:putative zinc finger protein
MTCRRVRRLLVEHVRGQVPEPTLVQLDLHVMTCAGCRLERARWATVGSLRAWSPPTLGATAQARILGQLRAAHADGSAEAEPSRRRRRAGGLGRTGRLGGAGRLGRLWWLAPTLAALALAVGSGGVATWHAHRAAVVAALALRPDAGAAAVDVPPPPPSEAFAGYALTRGPGAQIELRPDRRELVLRAGEIALASTAGSQGPLRVRAPGFVVVMHHASARFAPDEVHVLDGSIEVYATDNAPLALVGAGNSWRPDPPAAPAPGANLRVADGLERAHAALARGDAAGARHWLERLARGHLGRAERAEVELLGAEALLVDGRAGDAVRAYRAVARRHAGSAEGEAASFAAAQLSWEHASRSEARAALLDYLDRYPAGRFAREARDRLDELTAASP